MNATRNALPPIYTSALGLRRACPGRSLRADSRWQVASICAFCRDKLGGSGRGAGEKVVPSETSNAPEGAIGKTQDTKKPCDLQGLDGAGWLLKLNLVTPTGVEPVLPP